MVTQERLKELLNYDLETGVFTWRVDRNHLAKSGSVAGSINSCGYKNIWIDGKQYKASRLAWLYVYGVFPSNFLDHIDRDRKNDRISNLRIASRIENGQNLSIKKSNKSGFVGVSWHKRTSKWTSQIMIDGKKIYLGIFDTTEEAAAARTKAKAVYHTFNPEDPNEKAA